MSEVVQAAQDLSEYLSSAARSLQINVDGELESPIVTVLDTETEEVVRQIPSEELVACEVRGPADYRCQCGLGRADQQGRLTGL